MKRESGNVSIKQRALKPTEKLFKGAPDHEVKPANRRERRALAKVKKQKPGTSKE